MSRLRVSTVHLKPEPSALVERLGVERGRLVLQSRNDRDERVETITQEEVCGLLREPGSIA
jgi:hypothetical protein